ncbi:hypothetical protein C0993_003177 [Termitomyces sp. T159_Od127]|nr:hypothetical protein C0993_003177 [Termitomyces sp. T159_Od127]
MIGPTSTFYDPNAMVQGQGENQSDYQQWIEGAYGSHQQHPLHQQSMLHYPVHHPYHQQPQEYRHDSCQCTHASDQYGYSQHSYSQASPLGSTLAATTNQSGVGGLMAPPGDSASYLTTPASDHYVRYSPHTNPATGTNLNVSHQTSKPSYQQQQIPQTLPNHDVQNVSSHLHPQSQSQLHPFISIDTRLPFSSEAPNNGSHPQSSHSSSLSPAANSWNDDPTIHIVNAKVQATAPKSPSAKMLGPSSSKRMPRRITAAFASSPDNASKASPKRKRPNPGAEESSEEDEGENPFSGGISVGISGISGMGVVGSGTRSRL